MNEKILIIDDDELNSLALAKRLERRGFTVRWISDATQAMEILKTETFNLVLLDIVMPEVSGLEVLKQIRSQYTAEVLPIIMITMLSDSKDIMDAFENGANDYITKPIHIDAITARIHGQLSTLELYKARLSLKELEAIRALVITYHHEINTPLAILQAGLQHIIREASDLDQKKTKKMFDALDRIEETLEKVKQASEQRKIEYETYAQTSKMVKLKKGRSS